MSYFPTDIPFMSDEELIENGLKKPYKKPEIIKGTDLVPAVRCKECRNSEYDFVTQIRGCSWFRIPVTDDFFCAKGEKKE